jgi:ssDNA-binding Zn-finger/Zn-ribbon topoisomerase 1
MTKRQTCEACGGVGRLRQTDLGYWYTACDDHVVD